MPKRVDIHKLNPFDPADMRLIDAEWRRRNARRNRVRREVHGWVRVAAVIACYLVIAALVVALVYTIAIILLATAAR